MILYDYQAYPVTQHTPLTDIRFDTKRSLSFMALPSEVNYGKRISTILAARIKEPRIVRRVVWTTQCRGYPYETRARFRNISMIHVILTRTGKSKSLFFVTLGLIDWLAFSGSILECR